MGCFSGIVNWVTRRKKSNKKLMKEARNKRYNATTKNEKTTSGGMSFSLEFAPTKKRVPPGLLPIQKKPVALEELRQRAREAEERRQERLLQVSRIGRVVDEKRAQCEKKKTEIDERFRMESRHKMAAKMADVEANQAVLKNRCDKKRRMKKAKNVVLHVVD